MFNPMTPVLEQVAVGNATALGKFAAANGLPKNPYTFPEFVAVLEGTTEAFRSKLVAAYRNGFSQAVSA